MIFPFQYKISAANEAHPTVIASLVIRKYIVTTHALVETSEKSASALQTYWHAEYKEKKFICSPLLTDPIYISNLFGVP